MCPSQCSFLLLRAWCIPPCKKSYCSFSRPQYVFPYSFHTRELNVLVHIVFYPPQRSMCSTIEFSVLQCVSHYSFLFSRAEHVSSCNFLFSNSSCVSSSSFLFSIKNGLFWFMVFNATFNNISVISWQSVLLVEETGVPGENTSTCYLFCPWNTPGILDTWNRVEH